MADQNLRVNITAFDKTQRAFASVRAGLGRVKKAVFNVKTAVAGLAGAAGFGLFIKSTIETNRKFQSLEASLKTFLGSSKKAAGAFDVLQQFASKTPFSLQEVVGGFNRLISVGLNPSIAALEAFGNIASGTGKTLEQFVEAAADAAVGEFERLKEFGIKARSEGDKVVFTFKGVETEIKKNAASIEGYLKTLGQTEFAGATAEQANTLNGAFSNLGDTFDKFQVQVGKSGLNESINKFARALSNVVANSPEVATAIGEKLGGAVNKLTGILEQGSGGIKAFAFNMASQITEAALGAVTVLKSFTDALAKLPGVAKIDFSETIFGLAEMVEKFKSAAKEAGAEDGLAKSVEDLDKSLNKVLKTVEKTKRTLGDTFGFTKDAAEKTGDVIGESFGSAFTKLSEGTLTAKEAFKSMAQDIVKKLYEIFVVERLVKSISSTFTKSFTPSTPAPKKAIGGSVQRGVPTLVGERGAELFVPASSGSIVPNKEMGGGGVTVNQTINVSTGVAQTVRAEMVQLLPQVVNAAKAGVLDAKKRGGAYGSAF
jgi:hypothetical protein